MTSNKWKKVGKAKNYWGKELEQFIKDSDPLIRGRASIKKKSNPWRIVQVMGDGTFLVKPSKSDSLDFEGCMKGGRAIYLDCKSTGHETAFQLAQVSDAQLSYCQERASLGALTFLYVRARCMHRDFILPVDAQGRIAGRVHKRCDWLVKGPRYESINWRALRPYLVKSSEPWLDAMLRIYREKPWA